MVATGSTKDTSMAIPEAPKSQMVSLNYTLHDGSPTGKIIETTLEDVAKLSGLYTTGATYKPFEFVLGTNAVVPGFERGVASMKKGEKKTIEVLPKDGYGESTTTDENVQEYSIRPRFTVTVDKARFSDTISQTVQKSAMGEEGKNLTVGKTITGGQNITAKVTKIDGENITLEIDNKENPFYGKKLAVGVSTEQDTVDINGKPAKMKFTVKALAGTGVTLDVENGASPFVGKDVVVGATAQTPKGMITIKAINGENITLSVPGHPLAGKTLYFDIELLDIK